MCIRDSVGSFPEVVGDEVGLAVLHLIHAELFRRIRLDVSEFVVVVDRLDIEGEMCIRDRLNGARLAGLAFGDVENNRVGVQLWRDIAIDRAGCIVLKLGGDKPSRGLGRMVAADAGLRVAFKLVEGNADALVCLLYTSRCV